MKCKGGPSAEAPGRKKGGGGGGGKATQVLIGEVTAFLREAGPEVLPAREADLRKLYKQLKAAETE